MKNSKVADKVEQELMMLERDILFNRILKIESLPMSGVLLRYSLLFLSLLIIHILLRIIVGDQTTGILEYFFKHAFTSALISSLTVFIISFAYRYTVKNLSKVFRTSIVENRSKQILFLNIKKLVNINYQIFFVLIVTLLMAFAISFIEFPFKISFHSSLLVFFRRFVFYFLMNQGLYWAIVSPLPVKGLKDSSISELGGNDYSPFNTPLIRTIKRLFFAYSLFCFDAITMCTLGRYIVNLEFNFSKDFYWSMFLLIGVFSSFFTYMSALARIFHK